MPRHVVRDRAREDDDITQILSTMDTFEDKAADFNENFNWRRQWWHLLKPPKPAKINELSYIDDDEFTVKKSAFFRKTYKKIHEKEQRRESQTSLASSLNDSESEVEDEEKLKETKDEPWTMWNAYLFAQKTLFWSRIYILILQFIGANLFGDQFHTDAFRGADQSINVKESLVGEISVTKVFAGLRRWDAQQFLFIIDNDYIFETSLAFLPGYVGIVNFVKLIAASYSQWLLGFEVQGWVISSIVVVFLNLIFFHIAGMELFVITYQITRSIKIAMIAVSIFAYNPASIFFTAAYSESAYCLVTFTSIMMAIFAGRIDSLFTKSITTFLAAVFFAATVLLRSNGFLNIGFAMWYMLGAMLWESEDPIPDTKQFQDRMGSVRNRRAREELLKTYLEFEERRSVARKEFRFSNRGRLCIVSFSIVSTFTLLILVTTLPPFLFYGHTMTAEFCEKNSQQAMIARHWVKQHPEIAKNMIYAGQLEKLSFCRNPVMFDFWPTFYGAVQRKYWNVGLFGYWKLKKIPCFLMATPAFIITFLAIRFTFWDVFERRRWYNIWILFGRPDHLLPFALHAAFLLFVGIFMINAEVFTRIIFSSTPFLYIYLAIWIDSLTQGNTFGNRMLDYANFQSFYPIFITKRVWNSSFIAKFFCVYLFVYFVFGTIAHSAWLPFT